MGDVAQRTYLPGLGEAYPAGGTPMADYAYYTPDHLGSVRGIRGQDRSLSASYAYEPFGQTRAASGLPLNVGYTGHLWDATIQQYFAPVPLLQPRRRALDHARPAGDGRWAEYVWVCESAAYKVQRCAWHVSLYLFHLYA
jgi:hypothetical protein